MGTLQSFTELECWRASRTMVKAVYQVSAQGSFSRDFGLRDQIRKAAISAMSNIAEGFERGSRKENIHFLRIAKASVAEVESQLYAALDVGYWRPAEFGKLLEEATSAKRLIAGFIHYLLKCETRKPVNHQTSQPGKLR